MMRKMEIIFLLTIFINIFNPITSLPDGAPTSTCDTLLPVHSGGIPVQSSPSPFTIQTSGPAVGQGQIMHIEIHPPELAFGGFIIHARSTSPPFKVVGRFAPSSDGLVKLINCDGVDNTATHANTSPKTDLGLVWQAPRDFLGEVVFNATFAEEYDKFWVGVESSPVQVTQDNLTTTTFVTTTTTTPKPSADPFYDGCGSSKSCFGSPDGCVNTRSCRAVGSVIVLGESYQFEMKSGYNSPAYIAVGLSNDDKMGDDSVMECVPTGGTVSAHTSWTRGMPNYGITREQVPQNIIRLLEGSVVDGTIYCKVERAINSTVMGNNFDLVKNQYHLLIASGSGLKDNSVGYHDILRLSSSSPKYLAEISEFKGKSNLLLRLHAGFMLAAWIGTASVGILLARYFKQTWVGSSMCGKDQWFAWHRTFMILTWALTIAGFVIIFVQIGGWSAEQNPHFILGTVTTVLCFIQPFGALFRPAPSSKNRPIFNWLHWLVGNLAHIFAIVTIFYAVKLTKAELPEWFEWILVAFVGFHVVWHLILSIVGCISDRSHNQRVNTFPMAGMSPSRGNVKERKMDSPYSGLRKVLLTIYLVIVLLFVIALIVIAALAPIEDTVKSWRSKLNA